MHSYLHLCAFGLLCLWLHIVFDHVVLAEDESKWEVTQEKDGCVLELVLVGTDIADLLEHE